MNTETSVEIPSSRPPTLEVPEIRVPRDDDELEAIYELRYRVYVEEMQRSQKAADHQRKQIREALDRSAYIVGAFVGDRAIGTARMNFSYDSDIPYAELYPIAACAHDNPRGVAVASKLIVEPGRRGSRLCLELTSALYRHCLASGIDTVLLDTNAHLVRLYTRLGFVAVGDNVEHPLYGSVTIMKLEVNDLAHLERVGSPFARVHRAFYAEQLAA